MIAARSKTDENHRIFLAPDTDPHRWQEIIKLRPETVLEHYDIFRDYIILYIIEHGIPSILHYDFAKKELTEIGCFGDIGEVVPYANTDYCSTFIIFKYSSPFVYEREYKLDLKSKRWEIVDETRLSTPVRPELFVWKNVYPRSKDGVSIPLTIMHKKEREPGRPHKLLIETYGAYGIRMQMDYNSTLLSAMEQGWTVAFAHVRGSNFSGPMWYEAGCYPNKPRSIDDFIACVDWLQISGLTTPELTAAAGSSAGATLVAAAMNRSPEKFRAALLHNPYLDVLSVLLDKTLPLTETNYEEWGNPIESLDAYKQIKSYSPFDQLKSQEYPAMLVSYSTHDHRVPHWSVLKYLAKLRALSLCPTRFKDVHSKNIVSVTEDGGHFGSASSSDNLKHRVWELAWLDYVLDL